MEAARGQKQQTKVSQRKLNQVKVGAIACLDPSAATGLFVAMTMRCWSVLGRRPRKTHTDPCGTDPCECRIPQ